MEETEQSVEIISMAFSVSFRNSQLKIHIELRNDPAFLSNNNNKDQFKMIYI